METFTRGQVTFIRDTMVTATVDLPHVIADFGTQQPTHETNPQI